MSQTIRIGNAQAFWGDRPSAAKEILTQVPDLDYLTMDYLAEVSMSILALQRERNPQAGYPHDFVEVVRGLAPYWSSGGKCKLIANAGGLSPMACAQACRSVLEAAGCRSLKIGVVGGDDVLAILQMNPHIEHFKNLDTGESLASVQDRLVTANAYMGCSGIVDALKMGADIVITGRVADPSMVLAACVHHFQWRYDDWDLLAAGTLAGHLLECGTHATGGISTDWLSVLSPVDIGFPIAEVSREGDLVITKSDASGGCVTVQTVKEQLLYEISDPSRYISPDVVVSFLGLSVQQVDQNRVSVRGAKGHKQPETLKVSATYRDGYRAAGTLTIVGPQAVAKGRRCGEIVLKRLEAAGWNYTQTVVECLGNGASIPVLETINEGHDSFETVLRIAVESSSKAAVEAFSKEMIPLVTAGPQGTTGYAQGRPSVQPVFRYWPCLIEKKLVSTSVQTITTEDRSTGSKAVDLWPKIPSAKKIEAACQIPLDSMHTQTGNDPIPKRLSSIAYGRSGDKGISANIGILARNPEDYPWLLRWLTAQRVQEYFQSMGVKRVERFEAPNLQGLNFLVHGILSCSIRNDAQGKGLAQALLAMPIEDADV
ncbi:MAG: acyclic terpene utilization AtuA family protein [Pirellula sp.]